MLGDSNGLFQDDLQEQLRIQFELNQAGEGSHSGDDSSLESLFDPIAKN
jgi:hypothetical protein